MSTPEKPQKNLKQWSRLAILIALILLALKALDWQLVSTALMSIPLSIVVLLVFGELLFNWIESFRVKLLLGQQYKIAFIFRTKLLSSFLGNFMPGFSLSEIVRIMLLDRQVPGRKWTITLALLSNRVFGLLSLFGLIGIYLLFDYPPIIAAYLPRLRVIACVGSIAIFCLPLFMGIKRIRQTFIYCLKLTKDTKFYKFGLTAYFALRRNCEPKKWLAISLSSAFTSVIAVSQMWLVARAVGTNTTFFDWVFFTPFIAIFTFLPIGIGAIGSQDLAAAIVAKSIGQPVEAFIALSLTIHAARIIGSLPGIFYVNDAFLVLRALKNPIAKLVKNVN